MGKFGLMLAIPGLAAALLAAPAQADGAAETVAGFVAAGAADCCERIAAGRSLASLPGIGYHTTDGPRPFSGAIRFRTRLGDVGRMNDLSHRLDFDLHFTRRVADGVRLNMNLGTGSGWRGTDVIGTRPGGRIKRAWASVHLGERRACDCTCDCDCGK